MSFKRAVALHHDMWVSQTAAVAVLNEQEMQLDEVADSLDTTDRIVQRLKDTIGLLSQTTKGPCKEAKKM